MKTLDKLILCCHEYADICNVLTIARETQCRSATNSTAPVFLAFLLIYRMDLINASEEKDRQADTNFIALHRKDRQAQDQK